MPPGARHSVHVAGDDSTTAKTDIYGLPAVAIRGMELDAVCMMSVAVHVWPGAVHWDQAACPGFTILTPVYVLRQRIKAMESLAEEGLWMRRARPERHRFA